MDTRLEPEVMASLVDGYLPCAIAFNVARKLEVAPQDVGKAVDELGIRIINCQLGCFQLEKTRHNDVDSKAVSAQVIAGINSHLVDGRLSCASAFAIGREMKVSLKEIGDGTNKLKVKIASCQLGCFT